MSEAHTETRRAFLGSIALAALLPAIPAQAHQDGVAELVSVMEDYRDTLLRQCAAADHSFSVTPDAREEAAIAAHDAVDDRLRGLPATSSLVVLAKIFAGTCR